MQTHYEYRSALILVVWLGVCPHRRCYAFTCTCMRTSINGGIGDSFFSALSEDLG